MAKTLQDLGKVNLKMEYRSSTYSPIQDSVDFLINHIGGEEVLCRNDISSDALLSR